MKYITRIVCGLIAMVLLPIARKSANWPVRMAVPPHPPTSLKIPNGREHVIPPYRDMTCPVICSLIVLFAMISMLSCSKKATPSPPPMPVDTADMIRIVLSASVPAYDAAVSDHWVNITGAEYDNLATGLTGAGKYGAPEIYMNTSSSGGWSPDYAVGGNNNYTKVPASSYIVAWSVRTGNGISSSLNSKLKVSASQSTGFADYGSPLPGIGNIAVDTRVFFVLKKPSVKTSASPNYTAVYNALTFFLGNNTNSGSGPEYYSNGDNSSLTLSFPADSYCQVISTATKQWK